MFRKSLKLNASVHQASFYIKKWITPILNLLCVALIVEIKLHGDVFFWFIEALLLLGNTLNIINVAFSLQFPENDSERRKSVALFICVIFYAVAIMSIILYKLIEKIDESV